MSYGDRLDKPVVLLSPVIIKFAGDAHLMSPYRSLSRPSQLLVKARPKDDEIDVPYCNILGT